MRSDHDPFLQQISRAYLAYQKTLLQQNRLDFSHQQKLLYDLLLKPEISERIIGGIRHLLVDEYQDTNFIQ